MGAQQNRSATAGPGKFPATTRAPSGNSPQGVATARKQPPEGHQPERPQRQAPTAVAFKETSRMGGRSQGQRADKRTTAEVNYGQRRDRNNEGTKGRERTAQTEVRRARRVNQENQREADDATRDATITADAATTANT